MLDGTSTAGLRILPGYLDPGAQTALLEAVRRVLRRSPLITPTMPRSGKPFSVRMSNCGPLGWVSDRAGYRNKSTHPVTGEPWPPMPDIMLQAWQDLADYPHSPEACLVNWYAPGARMGLHRDADEAEFAAPVISLSLGDTAVFRIGGLERGDPTRSIRLASGDAVVLGGPARLIYHGVDRILPGTSRLLPEGGRINLTLRRVTRPA